MVKIGYYVKDESLKEKIWQLPVYDSTYLVYELVSENIQEILEMKIDLLIADFYPNEILRLENFIKINEITKIRGICVLEEYGDEMVEVILNHHVRYVCDLSISDKAFYVLILRILHENEELSVSIYERIETLCQKKGISRNLKGYHYIKSAILFYLENGQSEFLMKEVYDTIAKKYHTTSSRVEKNMRLAIQKSGSSLSNAKFVDACLRECLNG